jgi:hypothetical protein
MSAKIYSVQQANKALIAPPLPESAEFFFFKHEVNAGRIDPITSTCTDADTRWRALSQEAKAPFEKQAAEDVARWERQAKEFKNSGPYK